VGGGQGAAVSGEQLKLPGGLRRATAAVYLPTRITSTVQKSRVHVARASELMSARHSADGRHSRFTVTSKQPAAATIAQAAFGFRARGVTIEAASTTHAPEDAHDREHRIIQDDHHRA
jgi:hypothetical protein